MKKQICCKDDGTVALLGNPNVGKSSLFNALTGLSRHTGNWTGKTVDSMVARSKFCDSSLVFADLPGTYSLCAKSKEEEVCEDFLIFQNPGCTLLVADATCLIRTSILLFEVLELTDNVVLAINFMDEAEKQGIKIDTKKLEEKLKIPVIGVSARKKRGLDTLTMVLQEKIQLQKDAVAGVQNHTEYDRHIEDAIAKIEPLVKNNLKLPNRWLATRLLCGDFALFERIKNQKSVDLINNDELICELRKQMLILEKVGIDTEAIRDDIASKRVETANRIIGECISTEKSHYRKIDRTLDKIATGRISGTIVMLLALAVIFWITLFGANHISGCLSVFLDKVAEVIRSGLIALSLPDFITKPLCDGVLNVLFEVISVMLPPMAIFFPLFTILEDLGYLPRVAFNLDRHFKKCDSCGKQAYSMCMGLGCNAAGVTGCRIIDSHRERTLAILTNCLVPCNGKFPALTTLVTIFLIYGVPKRLQSVSGALILTMLIILSVFMTFAVTKLLSKTLLSGTASSFTLELPPYRKPALAKTLVRSFLDRGILIVSRAAVVSAPCGLVIWLLANITCSGETLLYHASAFLEPVGRLCGLDGTIILSFILGFPANEIVIPLIISGYSSAGVLAGDGGFSAIRELFILNGWNTVTAINTIVFMLFHWPCGTTLLTIKKETKSTFLTFLAFIIPTLVGYAICVIINLLSKLFI